MVSGTTTAGTQCVYRLSLNVSCLDFSFASGEIVQLALDWTGMVPDSWRCVGGSLQLKDSAKRLEQALLEYY